MNPHGPATTHHRDGRLIVCRAGPDAVQTANRTIEQHCRVGQNVNRAATLPPRITEIVSVHDLDTRSLHLLLAHHLDYRLRQSTVGNVVLFSKPEHAPIRTKTTLRLATPAYYRAQEGRKPGIRDPHDGTLAKDATRWAREVVSPGMQHAEVSFASSREPWVRCAAHYQLSRELSRLREYFADRYGYTTATAIPDPNAFATWLGISFALTPKTTNVSLGALDEYCYAHSLYAANPLQGSGSIDTIVRVYYGPVRYEDSSGRIASQQDWLAQNDAPRAWFTKRMRFATESEYRFAVSTLGDPIKPEHYIAVSPELCKLTSAL